MQIITLNRNIETSLHVAHDELEKNNELIVPEKLKIYYDLFRERFGPEKLRNINGEALLEIMHTHGNQESLVYWLEFKNDEEFPGTNFGSIAGGSAHKFGLFRRRETGMWVAGSVQKESNITISQAIEIAHKHRDQLIAGAQVLQQFPAAASDQDYLKLQQELEKVAADVSGYAWGHKYFSLLYPEKLDDYHSHPFQRFNLIKLLQSPPKEEGLYVCAGYFVNLARQFNWPINHLTSTLNKRNGHPIKYWRIGTRVVKSIWPAMLEGKFIAIGWAGLGDINELAKGGDLKEIIKNKLEPEYPRDAKTSSRKAGEIRNFVEKIEEGDTVLAAEGQNVLGVGRVTGEYRFERTEPLDAPHRRSVEWLSVGNWKLPENEGKLTTVFRLKYEDNFMEIEKRILGLGDASTLQVSALSPAALRAITLKGIPERIQGILERKNQVIIYGPPGTGKTYWARKAAQDLASIASFGKLFDDLTEAEKKEVEGDDRTAGLVRICTFHPAYGYEDFIEGYRPQISKSDQLVFEHKEGIFKTMCRDAYRATNRKFYLLIDEINRGDIPRIFGELLTLLEKDKRGMKLALPVSGELFSVPQNVFVIGTMNTADRSIALLDTALRRRFGFLELMPNTAVLAGVSVGGRIPLAAWLAAINERIRTKGGKDARNLQIGHAYFMEEGRPVVALNKFARIVAEDIIPLLEEYCYEDYNILKNILGEGLVDEKQQRIREELFAPAQQENLVQALSAISPEMSTSLEAAKEAEAILENDETEDPEEAEK